MLYGFISEIRNGQRKSIGKTETKKCVNRKFEIGFICALAVL